MQKNKKIIYYACLFLVVYASIIILGCYNNISEKQSTLNATENANKKENLQTFLMEDIVVYDRDAGVIRKTIEYDFLFGDINTRKQITKTIISCGCTSLGVTKGDTLDFSKPFKVIINPYGKPPGVGMETFILVFTDESVVRGNLKFDYLPLPTVMPKSLVFQKADSNKLLTLTFFGEKNVRVTPLELPANISIEKQDISEDISKTELKILFTVDRNNSDQTQEIQGFIKLSTSSPLAETIRIPYLVLAN
jgi:hypothetical protein